MSYLSFHAGTEGKVKKNEVKKSAGHTFRKTEKLYKTHKNKDIDMSKTNQNIDALMDNKTLDELVDERLEKSFKGKRALRKDAVVVREVIAQPSSDVFIGLTDGEKRQKMQKFIGDSLPWFQEEFGSENVLGLSGHMDESNPHVHFAIMPMTEDGRLSQKDFFKGPAGLKRMHREYREHMIANGWEFEIENKNEQAGGVSLDDYKKNAEAIEAQRSEYTELVRKSKDNDVVKNEAKAEIINDLLPKYKKAYNTKANDHFRDKWKKEYKEKYEKEIAEEKKSLQEKYVQDVNVATVRSQKINKYHDEAAMYISESQDAKQIPVMVKKRLYGILNKAPSEYLKLRQERVEAKQQQQQARQAESQQVDELER